LTISPALLEELKKSTAPVPKKLDSKAGKSSFSLGTTYHMLGPESHFRKSQIAAQADPIPKVTYIDNEPEFRWALLQDQMAFDKLHEGIKKFADDGETLKKLLRSKISA
jgi:transaldolase